MKNFQIILLVVFGILAALALAFFSGAISLPSKSGSAGSATPAGTITMWGTMPISQIKPTLDLLARHTQDALRVRYVQKSINTYQNDILNSFAFGGTPDILMLPNDLIYMFEDRLIRLPVQAFSERMFADTYIQAADVFRNERGMLGYPFAVDPLVLFYNRDHLEASGIISPPEFWQDLLSMVPTLTQKNQVLEIGRSAVAMGETANVVNFKEILLALNLQLGNNIVSRDTRAGRYVSAFSSSSLVSSKPAEETLKFYLEFSNPAKNVYSWNKSRPNSRQAFVGGDLSMYFGFASEIPTIRSMNPNLNFDVATIPKVDGLENNITYARTYSLAIPITSPNSQAAFYTAGQLANGIYTSQIISSSSLAPVRRDLLTVLNPASQFDSVINRAAIQSRSWIDPSYSETNQLFSTMVESVLSGLSEAPRAVTTVNEQLKNMLIR